MKERICSKTNSIKSLSRWLMVQEHVVCSDRISYELKCRKQMVKMVSSVIVRMIKTIIFSVTNKMLIAVMTTYLLLLGDALISCIKFTTVWCYCVVNLVTCGRKTHCQTDDFTTRTLPDPVTSISENFDLNVLSFNLPFWVISSKTSKYKHLSCAIYYLDSFHFIWSTMFDTSI